MNALYEGRLILRDKLLVFGLLVFLLLLAGCSNNGDGGASVSAVEPTVYVSAPKVLTFSWSDVGADYYKLLKDPDGISGYTQVGEDIFSTNVDERVSAYLHDWVNARYIIQSCAGNDVCADSQAITTTSLMLDIIGYFKASNAEEWDQFGNAVSLSSDGSTMAVAAFTEDSSATDIDGDQSDNSAENSGAVYIFIRNGNTWSQQAYLKASNANTGYLFGYSISLSADGNYLAVGSPGIPNGVSVGAVYVFNRSDNNWIQQSYIEASNKEAGDFFGLVLDLSADGSTLAVGAVGEGSSATGVDGNQNDNSASSSGAVYVFGRNDASWSQQAYIKASNTEADDNFGDDVSLSADGSILAVGASSEDSNASGIDGDQNDNSASSSGAVYIFARDNSTWTQQAYIKASNAEANDRFGLEVCLSADGNDIAIASASEDSGTTGINGDQNDNSAVNSGAVYLFNRSDNTWSQQAYIKSSNTDEWDGFGQAVSLSRDGNTLIVSASNEDSSAKGIAGDQSDNSAEDSGAVYVFTRRDNNWTQQAYVKASNAEAGDRLGVISLSDDGSTLAVGSTSEDSGTSGISGDQNDNTAISTGAVYLY